MQQWCCDFIAGWSGGVMGLIVGHPLDTLKVRQQVLPKGGNSILSLTKSTYRLEGWRGFFKGIAYPVLGAGIYNALLFGVYGNSLRLLQNAQYQNPRKRCCEGEPPDSSWHRDVFIAGCVGGVATVLYSCPIEVIKTKLQVQTVAHHTYPSPYCRMVCRTEPTYSNSFDAFFKIYKNYGVCRGLYKGCWCMLLRDVPTFGLYMVSYEHLLCLLDKDNRSEQTTFSSQIISGGIAGFLSWVTVAPLDVIKSRLQADDIGKPIYKGIVDCCKKIIAQDGVKALFSGITLAAIRSVPVNSITFVVYEFNLSLCQKWI